MSADVLPLSGPYPAPAPHRLTPVGVIIGELLCHLRDCGPHSAETLIASVGSRPALVRAALADLTDVGLLTYDEAADGYDAVPGLPYDTARCAA